MLQNKIFLSFLIIGMISPMYHCTQLRSSVTMYRDVADRPIEEDIHYDAGCELRRKTPPIAAASGAEKKVLTGN